MNKKTLLALAALLLPLMLGAVACDDNKNIPCVPGPGMGTGPGTTSTATAVIVRGTYTCGPNGEKTFTPDPPTP